MNDASLDNTAGQNVMLPYDIVDVHAHFFPHRWLESAWRFFEDHSWRINYKDRPDALADMLAGFWVLKSKRPKEADMCNGKALEVIFD